MPDVLTHVLIGLSVAVLVWGVRITEKSVLMVLGSILPDIERPLTWILQQTSLNWLDLKLLTHSLLGGAVLSFFAATCFITSNQKNRLRNTFVIFFFGTVLHLLADMTMYQWEELGIHLFYPLKIPFSFNIVWPDFVYFPVIGLCIFGASILVSYFINKRFPYSGEVDNRA